MKERSINSLLRFLTAVDTPPSDVRTDVGDRGRLFARWAKRSCVGERTNRLKTAILTSVEWHFSQA